VRFSCFIINGGWSITEWAIASGMLRIGQTDLFVEGSATRSEALTIFIAFCLTVSYVLQVRIQLVFIIAIYACCYYFRAIFNQSTGFHRSCADPALLNQYLGNLLPSRAADMGMWTYFPFPGIPDCVIVNEFSWFFIACGSFIGLSLLLQMVHYQQASTTRSLAISPVDAVTDHSSCSNTITANRRRCHQSS